MHCMQGMLGCYRKAKFANKCTAKKVQAFHAKVLLHTFTHSLDYEAINTFQSNFAAHVSWQVATSKRK